MANMMVIGVDIGGTHMRSALVDSEGQIILRRRTFSENSSGASRATERLIQECRALMDDAARLGGRVAAVGLGVAGKIDSENGRVMFSPHLPALNGHPLASELRDRLEIPVVMENDANAFGIGESWMGAGLGLDNWIGVTLGTGVGGCLFLGGRLWQGDQLGFVGEVGHMIVHPDGPRCACGQNGCLEAHASASALLEGVESAASRGILAAGPLFDFWRARKLTAERVFHCANQGNAVAQALFQRMGWALGLALANLFRVLGIRHAIIGGGVSSGWDQFIIPLEKSMSQYSCMLDIGVIDVRRSVLGDDAALLGSARLAVNVVN
jgi:glucokinase